MIVSPILLQPQSIVSIDTNVQCSVMLADSDREFRQGLRSLLSFYSKHGAAEYVVVGEVASGAQALHLAKSQHPSLVIVDVDVDQNWDTTLETLAQLQQLDTPPKVLLISEEPKPDYLFSGMRSGASGYLSKGQLSTELLTAIHTIERGDIYLSQVMINTFFYLFQSHAKQSTEKCKQLRLSTRERELLTLLSRGKSNDDIANDLCISVATVKSHFTSIFEKLGVKSRTQAIVRSLRLGLVQ